MKTVKFLSIEFQIVGFFLEVAFPKPVGLGQGFLTWAKRIPKMW